MSIPIFGNESLIPPSIGPLSLEDIEIYPDPRLGARIRYASEIVRADTYLYDQGVFDIPEDLRSEVVWDLYAQAYLDVLRMAEAGMYLDLESQPPGFLHLPRDAADPFCIWAVFVYRQPLGPGVEFPGRSVSHLALRTDRGYVNKVRYTYPEDEGLADKRYGGFLAFFVEWTAVLYSSPVH